MTCELCKNSTASYCNNCMSRKNMQKKAKIRNENKCSVFSFGEKTVIIPWEEHKKHGNERIKLLSVNLDENGLSLTLNGIFQAQFSGEIKEVFDFFIEFIKTDPRNNEISP